MTTLENLQKKVSKLSPNFNLTESKLEEVKNAINSQNGNYPRHYDYSEIRFTFTSNDQIRLSLNYGKL